MIPARTLSPDAQPDSSASFRRRPPRRSGAIGVTAHLPVRNLRWEKCLLPSLVFALLFLPAFGQVLHHREFSVLGKSTQLLVVTTPAWTAQTGVLYRYERSRPNTGWRQVGHAIGVVVGKNGLGWEERPKPNVENATLEDADDFPAPDPGSARKATDPVKKAGDLRSPAGVFRIGPAFGRAAQEPPGWKMPYSSLSSSTKFPNDPTSKFHDQVLARTAMPSDGNSAEPKPGAGSFDWGLILQQNAGPIRPGDGSCTFLDVWSGPGEPTTGCTATAKEQIKILLGWLDPNRQPLLVQLPAEEYTALEKSWGLPPIAAQHHRD